jgi:NAD(P)-dependent dehydrogenase (short-subunit alcohol dehydrogenase family)
VNPSRPLVDRIALVSGGAQGIGFAIGARFAEAGARVILLDRDAETGAAAAAQLSAAHPQTPVEFVAADLLIPEQIERAMHALRGTAGRIDVLVNNAGIEVEQDFAATSVDTWDRILGVNLRGAFLLTQAALPLFPGTGGAIVNISSIHATHAFAGSLPYACSKAGLLALTRNLALELGPRHIRVNAICPGYVDTRLWDEYLRHATDPRALAAATAALHPVGRRGLPADVAEAALFLAADGAAFVTGTDLVVDGGLTIRAHP